MDGIDWGVLRIQYEVMGETVDSLIESYGVSRTLLEYAIEEEGWKQSPASKAAQDWQGISQLQDIGEDLIAEVDARMDAVRLLKDCALNPRYVAFETAILGKGLEVIRAITPDAPTAAAQLKAVTEVLGDLKEKSGLSKVVGEEPKGGVSVKVNILGHVGADAKRIDATEVFIEPAKAIDCSPQQ